MSVRFFMRKRRDVIVRIGSFLQRNRFIRMLQLFAWVSHSQYEQHHLCTVCCWYLSTIICSAVYPVFSWFIL